MPEDTAPRTFGQPMVTAAQALSVLTLVIIRAMADVANIRGVTDTDTAREVIARLRRVYRITE
jgi:hypothetical protein